MEDTTICDPLTIAGVALSGVSTALNSAANTRVENARNDALSAERIRQKTLDSEASTVNTQARDNYNDFGAQQGADATKLGDYFAQQQVPAAPTTSDTPASSSNITVQETNKQNALAKASTDKSAAALGQLRSFGDLLGNKSLDTARSAGEIGQIGGFKQGSSAVLPYELDAASQAGSGLSALGQLVGGVGSISTSAGLQGKTLGSLFGSGPTVVSNNGMAAVRAADRASVPGYAGVSSLYGRAG